MKCLAFSKCFLCVVSERAISGSKAINWRLVWLFSKTHQTQIIDPTTMGFNSCIMSELTAYTFASFRLSILLVDTTKYIYKNNYVVETSFCICCDSVQIIDDLKQRRRKKQIKMRSKNKTINTEKMYASMLLIPSDNLWTMKFKKKIQILEIFLLQNSLRKPKRGRPNRLI